MRRRDNDKCACCGGREFAVATDNHGNRYLGCKRCRLLTTEETERMLRATTVPADELRRKP